MARYVDGFAFADSILDSEQARKILADNIEFFETIDPNQIESFVANLALNYLHCYEVDPINPDAILYGAEIALHLAKQAGISTITTDIDDQEFGSPWSIHVETPAQYLTVVQGFFLEDDERTIRYHQNPSKADEVINLLEANRIKYNMTPDNIQYIAEDVACLPLDEPDYELAPLSVYQRFNSYLNSLAHQ